MTEAPLVSFVVPDRFEIDGPLVVRALDVSDIPTSAPAFRDPGVGGENGMPPFEEGNDASERVLERARFTREGVKRRLLRHDGGRADATLFSLLPGE